MNPSTVWESVDSKQYDAVPNVSARKFRDVPYGAVAVAHSW